MQVEPLSVALCAGLLLFRASTQVLDLSHQPCLQEPAVLILLRQLTALTQLSISITGTGWTPRLSSWQQLAQLTGLLVLNVSGWGMCAAGADGSCCTSPSYSHSAGGGCNSGASGGHSSVPAPASQSQPNHAGAGGAAGVPSSLGDQVIRQRCTPAPLHYLGCFQKLQQLVMTDWEGMADAAGASLGLMLAVNAVEGGWQSL